MFENLSLVLFFKKDNTFIDCQMRVAFLTSAKIKIIYLSPLTGLFKCERVQQRALYPFLLSGSKSRRIGKKGEVNIWSSFSLSSPQWLSKFNFPVNLQICFCLLSDLFEKCYNWYPQYGVSYKWSKIYCIFTKIFNKN